MLKVKTIAALVAAPVLFSATANAASYVTFAAGEAFPRNVHLDGTLSGSGNQIDVNLKNGEQLSVAVGYEMPQMQLWGTSPRVEFEYSYRDFNVDTISSTLVTSVTGAGGNIDVSTFLVNAYADIDMLPLPWVKPYVGIGLGAGFVKPSISYSDGTDTTNISDSKTVLASQLVGGVAYDFNKQIAFFADVRYLYTSKFKSDVQVAGTSVGTVKDNISAASVNLGVKYTF